MKLMKYLLSAAAIMILAGSCAKADPEYDHTDNTISAIYIAPAFASISATVSGKINQETGEILFPIGKRLASSFDLTKIKVRANVPYDVQITPSLSGIKDLSEPYTITVTATQTGVSKKYTLQAYYSSDL